MRMIKVGGLDQHNLSIYQSDNEHFYCRCSQDTDCEKNILSELDNWGF